MQAGVYEGFKLSGDTKEDVATIRLKIAETESPAYRLRIIKLNQSDEPMVKADDNLLTKLNTDDVDIEGVYKYTIPAGTAKVKVNITTSVHGADVKIGDFDQEHKSSTQEVVVNLYDLFSICVRLL